MQSLIQRKEKGRMQTKTVVKRLIKGQVASRKTSGSGKKGNKNLENETKGWHRIVDKSRRRRRKDACSRY